MHENPFSALTKAVCSLIFLGMVLVTLWGGWSYFLVHCCFTLFGLALLFGGFAACAVQPGLAIGFLLLSILGVVLLFLGGQFTWAFELLGKIDGHTCIIIGACIGAFLGLFIAAHKKG